MRLKVRGRMSYADRRRQILALASAIIQADGLGALTMEALAERAAVSKPVVYAHFASSRHVAVALLREHYTAVSALFAKRVSSARDLDSYLEAVVDAALAYDSVSETPVRKMTNGFSAGDEINATFLAHQAAFRDHWRHLLVLLGIPWRQTSTAAIILASMVTNVVVSPNSRTRKADRATLVCMLTAAIDAERKRHGADQTLRTFDEPIYDFIRRAQAELGATRTAVGSRSS